MRESCTLSISKQTKDLTNQKFCSSFSRGLYEEGSGTQGMEKIDDPHYLRRSTHHVPIEQQEDNQQQLQTKKKGTDQLHDYVLP